MPKNNTLLYTFNNENESSLLHFGSTNPVIRMYILMLDTRNVEQTNDVRMYIEEFILVDIWMHCCTSWN